MKSIADASDNISAGMVAKVAIILFAAVVIVLLVAFYMRNRTAKSTATDDTAKGVERFATNPATMIPIPGARIQQEGVRKSVSFRDPVANSAPPSAYPVASEPGDNEDFIAVDFTSSVDKAATTSPTGACFPQDRLTPEDLLPKDAANSKWAQVVPAGQGDVKDQNFLTAGFHVGVDTVGQTRKNANLQLRSELPNPKMAVSPWLNSSYEPDQYRRGFELGES
jgi:hypothetical protein